MKFNIAILGIATLLLAGCSENKKGGFALSGKLTDTKGQMLYLEKLLNQPVLVDSARIDDEGHFEFTEYQPKIGFYRLKSDEKNFIVLVLDSADKVTVTGSLKDLNATAKVSGSAETDLFNRFSEIMKQKEMRIDSLTNRVEMDMQAAGRDSVKAKSIVDAASVPYHDINKASSDQVAEVISKNTDKYASIIGMQNIDPDAHFDVLENLVKGLKARFPKDQQVRSLGDMIARAKITLVGQPAPDITLPDPEGKEISLSSLRGKVVLVDFWASWCKPCRNEMPNVVAAYKKFKSKGFEIYGVSLDEKHDSWVEAIKADGITWPQVSDLKQFNSAVVDLYSIQAIPFTVLIDREGKILAKGLRGEELEKRLDEILNGKGGTTKLN